MRIVGAILCLIALGSPSVAATLQAQLLPATGEVRLRNNSQAAVPLVFYSVASPGGALNAADVAWNSIADNYDVNGDGSVDSRGSWIRFPASENELAEGVLLGPGGVLAVEQTISLGKIWQVGMTAFPDLAFTVTQPNGQPVDVGIEFVLDGDYDRNGMVDMRDYLVWRSTHKDAVADFSGADGNGDGLIDDQDHTLWKSSFGAALRPDGGVSFGTGSAAALVAVPEPTTIVVVACGILLSAACRLRRSARRDRQCGAKI